MKARYVFGEAWSIARSGPRQTIMAVLLVALSLYVPALLALLAKNLGRLAGEEAAAPAVVVTLEREELAREIANRLAEDRRIARLRIVGSAAALERFRRSYPQLGEALRDLSEAPFPPTLEVELRPGVEPDAAGEIASAARGMPGVEAAEAEEEAGRRFRNALTLLRGTGIFLGAILAAAAVLSVASTIRLALDLHREEIEIMRLMGATEAAVRAPFWLHATVVGLVGGAFALGALYVTWRAAIRGAGGNPLLTAFLGEFLSLPVAFALPLAGAAAGLLGSLLSTTRR
ncbi:MAG TPA: permease-like cell division protein FtsX [Thermoanaerobaculia bacterium]|jgi:cell division transport system permease protein